MRRGPHKEKCHKVGAPEGLAVGIAATRRPTQAQRRYLERGLMQAGGKLPLFDRNGREVSRKTIGSCVAQGWATPWVHNPIKPDWLVCRLTDAGYRVLGGEPPLQRAAAGDGGRRDGR
jgi:hypothetical protein